MGVLKNPDKPHGGVDTPMGRTPIAPFLEGLVLWTHKPPFSLRRKGANGAVDPLRVTFLRTTPLSPPPLGPGPPPFFLSLPLLISLILLYTHSLPILLISGWPRTTSEESEALCTTFYATDIFSHHVSVGPLAPKGAVGSHIGGGGSKIPRPISPLSF